MRWLRKQPRTREVRRQGAPMATRFSPTPRPEDPRRMFTLDGVFKPFHIITLLNGSQDARPGNFRFAYAESPAKQRRDSDVRDIAHNPNEVGRICILFVCGGVGSNQQPANQQPKSVTRTEPPTSPVPGCNSSETAKPATSDWATGPVAGSGAPPSSCARGAQLGATPAPPPHAPPHAPPRRIPCACASHLGRKTRSAFFTPSLASAFFTRSLRVFYVILRFFYLPAVRVFYSDPPPRFYRVYNAFFLTRFSFLAPHHPRK